MLYASPAITAYALVVVGLLGLAMGSFINCWAWRSTHGESILAGRSHCTSCGHELGARDLVPVLSWLFTRGACRYCGQKVSARYPLTEIACAAVFVGIVAVYGLTLESVELLVFAAALLFLSLTDLDDYIIPDGCILVCIAARIVYLGISFACGEATPDELVYYAASGLGMGAVLLAVTLAADRMFGRESMGGGDLKLYFVAGLYFGWQQGLLVVILSCIIGIAAALLGLGSDAGDVGGADASDSGETADGPDESAFKRTIPFGPSIAAACVVTMLAGEPLITWYLSLFW